MMNARMAKMGVAAALFLGLALSSAHAEWATVGAACSPDGIMANSNGFLVCSGGVWVANSLRAGNTVTTCNSGNAGYIRWSGSTFEGCDGSSWVQLVGGTGLKVYQADGVTEFGNYMGNYAEGCGGIVYADNNGTIYSLTNAICNGGSLNIAYFSGAGCTGTTFVGGTAVAGYCCTGSAACTTNRCAAVGASATVSYQSYRNTSGVCSVGAGSLALYNTHLTCSDGISPCRVK